MSTHPNVILMLVLTPDDLSRKTYRNILEESMVEDVDDYIQINEEKFNHMVMEDYYNESNQISAPKGSIVVYDLVTYGHGEKILWSSLEKRKESLEKWGSGICLRHHCSMQTFISANYW